MVVWVELVVTGMAPDEGAGVALIVYVTFPALGGGVHSMVTVDSPIPCVESLTLTLLGGAAEKENNLLYRRYTDGTYVTISFRKPPARHISLIAKVIFNSC